MTSTDSAKRFLIEADEAFDRENYELAVELYKKVIEIEPEEGSAWNSLGNALFSLDRFDEALDVFTRGEKRFQLWHAMSKNRGMVLITLNRFDEAVEALERALRINDADGFAWERFSYAHKMLKQYDRAYEAITRALALERFNPQFWLMRGRMEEIRTDFAGAGWCYLKGYACDRERTECMEELAVMLKDLRFHAGSIRAMEFVQKVWRKENLKAQSLQQIGTTNGSSVIPFKRKGEAKIAAPPEQEIVDLPNAYFALTDRFDSELGKERLLYVIGWPTFEHLGKLLVEWGEPLSEVEPVFGLPDRNDVNPLDGIRIYRHEGPPAHLVLLTLGLSDLYGENAEERIDESIAESSDGRSDEPGGGGSDERGDGILNENADEMKAVRKSRERRSGKGFELMMRVPLSERLPPRESVSPKERVPSNEDVTQVADWALTNLCYLAEYLLSGKDFQPGQLIDCQGSILFDLKCELEGFAIVEPMEFKGMQTASGNLDILHLVGVTRNEMNEMNQFGVSSLLDKLARRDQYLITDPDRPSVIGDQEK